MSVKDIKEFHYIIPLENLPSVFDKGILSHNEAEPYKKDDISMNSVQQIRASKVIPAEVMGQARKIHDCANLYFNAKNPMLSSRRSEKSKICVLRLKPDLLDLPDAVISDRNAAAKEARFYKAADGVQKLAMSVLFGKYWTSKFTPETNERNGHLRCAELLLPRKIHPSYIGGIYVANDSVKDAVTKIFPPEKFPQGCPVPVSTHPSFFFDAGPDQVNVPLHNTQFATPVEFAEEQVPAPAKERIVIDLTNDNDKLPEVAKIEAIKTEALEKKSTITFHEGDLLNSKMQTLVNTVNCKGVMGKGIALEFKKRFPAMFLDYKDRCDKQAVKPGVPYIYKTKEEKCIVNFPTKDHWKKDSDLSWIQKGLDHIKTHYKEWGITSLALPPLGCGNGGLNWNIVRSMIMDTLGDIDIPVEIYGEKI
ncbi:MAG: DarT ssDNA thymidine ADP-ribosyltransferase family protein [Chlamydiales bacterium]|nr:DarT ssDNA thymidine ADP-ribosyltransferase family protein [Chlamydiales bacterium]